MVTKASFAKNCSEMRSNTTSCLRMQSDMCVNVKGFFLDVSLTIWSEETELHHRYTYMVNKSAGSAAM